LQEGSRKCSQEGSQEGSRKCSQGGWQDDCLQKGSKKVHKRHIFALATKRRPLRILGNFLPVVSTVNGMLGHLRYNQLGLKL
jgi:hypothetical protein